jgi:prevent-host-death family protein
MTTHIVNTHEAKSRLSDLIRKAEAGDDVVLARNGRPVAKIIPWPPARAARHPGAWAGRVEYRDEAVGPDHDVTALFDESARSESP